MTDHILKSKSPKNREYVFKRNHSDANITKLKQKLSNVDWHDVLDNTNADHDYDKFLNTFIQLYNECVPLKKCTYDK